MSFSVQQRDLVKDITVCADVLMSKYKTRHPDDTDEPQDVGLSSDDEATGMEEYVGIARRLTLPKPSLGGPSGAPGKPSATTGSVCPASPLPEGFMKLGPDEIVINKCVLQSIKRGADLALKGKLPASFASFTATSGDLPFEVPQPLKHATHCDSCRRDFPTSKALRRHLRMHRGETRHMYKKCGKHLTSSHMMPPAAAVISHTTARHVARDTTPSRLWFNT